MFRKLDETISVAGQVRPDDMAEAARQGFTAIVNNRPDAEEPGQPSGAEIEAAAAAAGLSYRAIPVTHAGIAADQVTAMRAALAAAEGPMLAFCRSGTRSTFLWGLARLAEGDDPGEVQAKAAGAGYDIRPILPR